MIIMFLTDFWKKNLEFTSDVYGYFHFSVCSSTFLTAFWLLLFVSAEPSRTILLIDRSEPRFESHTGGKITKTLKNDQHFDGFCWISPTSDSKLFRTDQENERRDIQLSIEKKIISPKRLQKMLHLKMYPLPFIWLES